jgi:protein TonB
LSILVHATIVGTIIIVPLMAPDVLPAAARALIAVAAAPPMPDPPPAPRAVKPVSNAPPATAANRDAAPVRPAEEIVAEQPRTASVPGIPAAQGGFDAGGLGPPGIASSLGIPGLPPSPDPTVPIRAGGKVKYPEKVHDVRPVYPQIAISTKIEGRVIIEAILGIDGRVKDAKILKSIALLDRAALEAVEQWRFTPTLLNGVPVPVIITVSIDFKLH